MKLTNSTFLALGDSYTIGESVKEAERWPSQLVTQLQIEGIKISQPRIVAQTGWTTDELQMAINLANFDTSYDLVSLSIGVNNQYRGYPIEQQQKEFEELLAQAIIFAGGDPKKVFVVSIPDYGVTPFGKDRDPHKIKQEINEYNELNRKVAEASHIAYFDITPISREADKKPEYVAADGLHPSGIMYSKWVDIMFPWVFETINK